MITVRNAWEKTDKYKICKKYFPPLVSKLQSGAVAGIGLFTFPLAGAYTRNTMEAVMDFTSSALLQ